MKRASIRAATALLCAASLACASTPPPPTTPEPPVADTPAPEPDDSVVSAESGAPKGKDGDKSSDPASADPTTAEGQTADGQPVDPSNPDAPAQGQQDPSGGMGQRAESAVEGLIIGTVLGGQVAGAYGAAVGAAVFGLYGLITGDVPFDTGKGKNQPGPKGGQGTADEALETEIEEELSRQEALEKEIEDELRRQEELLDNLDKQENADKAIRSEQERRLEIEQADELAAPRRPFERDIPDSIFDRERRRVGDVEKFVKTLDADRDGRPEIEIVFDDSSGNRESRSEDTNYDGLLDTQNVYKGDKVVSRTEDTNYDGQVDTRITYDANEVAIKKEVDTNYDGKDDAFFIYEDGALAYEQRDLDNNGQIDRRVEYERRSRVRDMEDTDGNGQWDVWTYYDVSAKPSRIEKDTNGDGAADVWEYYEGPDAAQMLIVKRDEDLDKDGSVDISSYYDKGKLSRKEVLNPGALN